MYVSILAAGAAVPARRLAEPALELLVVHLAVAVLVQHLCTNTWGASPSEYTKWKGGFASKFTWGGGASPSKYTREGVLVLRKLIYKGMGFAFTSKYTRGECVSF